MPNQLILKTDGSYEVKNMNGYRDIQKAVGGHFTELQHRNGWGSIAAFANEAGMCERLPVNTWSFLMDILGFYITWTRDGIWGDVLINGGEAENGNDKAVPNAIIELVKDIKEFDGSNDDLLEFIDKSKFVKSLELVRESRNKKLKSNANKLKRKRVSNDDDELNTGDVIIITTTTTSKKQKIDNDEIKLPVKESCIIHGSTAKMPFRITSVIDQIKKHPKYPIDVSSGCKSFMEGTHEGLFSWLEGSKNKYYRIIWKYFYLNEKPEPQDEYDWIWSDLDNFWR